MTVELKLRKIGNSVGVVPPREALAQLNAQEGDTLLLTQTPDGFRVTSHNPEFASSMDVFADLSRRYRNTLRELAK